MLPKTNPVGESFSILNYLDKLTSDGGSETAIEKSYRCPVCDATNFKVNLKTGAYSTFVCDCANSEAGKKAIREAVSPSTWTKPPRPESRQAFIYDRLVDEALESAAQVVREDDGEGNRRFHQEHWNGRRWTSGLPDDIKAQVRLYRIYCEVNEKAKEKQPIFLVEGEGKADRLIALGIPATCAIGGAGKWKSYGYPNYLEDLNGHQIVLCPDRDKPGLKHCEQVEADLKANEIKVKGWLYAFPASFWWNRLPANKGADIADWIDELEKQGLVSDAIREQILGAVEPKRDLSEAKPSSPDSGQSKQERRAVPDQLIDLVLGEGGGVELFHTPDDEAYADIYSGGTRKTFPLRGKGFRQWLKIQFYQKTQKSPGGEAVEQAIGTLEAYAAFQGQTREVNLRVAEHEGRIYLDLGRDDWSVTEVSPDGWRLVSDAPVRFRRVATQLPLPLPESGGSLESLRELLGLSGETWAMVAAWLVNCLKPAKTYPCLILHGEAGSGKSTLSGTLKRLIDPGRAPLLPSVGDLRNLSVQANNRHLVVYDNLSGVSAEQSDAICRIATGGGFSHRTLHTDCEETVLEFVRPQLLNGIDSIATRGDLLDRSILVSLTRPERRRDATEFDAEFERLHPQVLGALLDVLSAALGNLPGVDTSQDVRMVEFARLAIAAEESLGCAPGEFMAAYQGNRAEAHETAIEASPVAQAILDLMDGREVWQGTASELLTELKERAGEAAAKSRAFPSDTRRLGVALKRLSPDLRAVGVDVDSHRRGQGKTYITLERIANLISPLSPLSPSPQKLRQQRFSESGMGDIKGDIKGDIGGGLMSPMGTGDIKGDIGGGLMSPLISPDEISRTTAGEALQKSGDKGDKGDIENPPYSGGGQKFAVGDRVVLAGEGVAGAAKEDPITGWTVTSRHGGSIWAASDAGALRQFPSTSLAPCSGDGQTREDIAALYSEDGHEFF
jgi:hypothetical protein